MPVKPVPVEPASPYFREASLKFLRGLRRHNDREWFEAHRPEYERDVKLPMLAVIEAINNGMADFAPDHVRPPQKCMMRIYRDIRFSKDKRPYKSNVSAWWSRAGLEKTSGGGYYMHVSPDEVVIAAGVYMPERDQLIAIRQHLLVHHAEVRKLLSAAGLRRKMQAFNGKPLTRAPKGFPKEHPGMDLILCRQWGVESTLEAKVSLQQDFAREVLQRFRLAAPLVDALNTPLLLQVQKKRRPMFGF